MADPEIIITAPEPSSSHGTTATDSNTAVTRKRSLVWAYFQESSTQPKEAICTLCEQTVSTCGNTTNMVKVSHHCYCSCLYVHSITIM